VIAAALFNVIANPLALASVTVTAAPINVGLDFVIVVPSPI